jgi:hypothetical protein
MSKNFSELAIGARFVYNNIEYIKTEDVRISCCKVINCYVAADANQKTFLQGDVIVTAHA